MRIPTVPIIKLPAISNRVPMKCDKGMPIILPAMYPPLCTVFRKVLVWTSQCKLLTTNVNKYCDMVATMDMNKLASNVTSPTNKYVIPFISRGLGNSFCLLANSTSYLADWGRILVDFDENDVIAINTIGVNMQQELNRNDHLNNATSSGITVQSSFLFSTNDVAHIDDVINVDGNIDVGCWLP